MVECDTRWKLDVKLHERYDILVAVGDFKDQFGVIGKKLFRLALMAALSNDQEIAPQEGCLWTSWYSHTVRVLIHDRLM